MARYIQPIFTQSKENNNTLINAPKKIHYQKSELVEKSKRKVRSDKTHNIKFPVDPILQMRLRTACKKASRFLVSTGREKISQTKFNTKLLNYGLHHRHLISRETPYPPSKVFMHTQPLETVYQEIGGPYGLAIEMGMSERQTVYCIVTSILNYIEREGMLDEII